MPFSIKQLKKIKLHGPARCRKHYLLLIWLDWSIHRWSTRQGPKGLTLICHVTQGWTKTKPTKMFSVFIMKIITKIRKKETKLRSVGFTSKGKDTQGNTSAWMSTMMQSLLLLQFWLLAGKWCKFFRHHLENTQPSNYGNWVKRYW